MLDATDEPREPMWDDAHIKRRLAAWDEIGTPSKAHTALAVMMEMRDALQARINELEQQLAACQQEQTGRATPPAYPPMTDERRAMWREVIAELKERGEAGNG